MVPGSRVTTGGLSLDQRCTLTVSAHTRAGGGAWQAKSRAFLVCARCRSLH
jgi:hypothetical protein